MGESNELVAMTRDAERIWSSRILQDNDISDRSLRNWVVAGKFPPPDGNLNGKNFWLRETYQQWKADVLAGRYSRPHRPGSPARAA